MIIELEIQQGRQYVRLGNNLKNVLNETRQILCFIISQMNICKRKKLLVPFLFIISCNFAFSQQAVKCGIFDMESKMPLAYTLIRSKVSSAEFVADEDGYFVTHIINPDDSLLVFNSLYLKEYVSVKDLINKDSIFLTRKIRMKPEVVDRDIVNFKIKKIGNISQKAKGKKFELGYGQQVGVAINNDFENNKVEILSVRFWVHKSGSRLLPLSVSFYEIDGDGDLGERIFVEPMIFYVRSKKNDELFEYNVSNSRILIPKKGVYVKIMPLPIGGEVGAVKVAANPSFFAIGRGEKLNIGFEVMIY